MGLLKTLLKKAVFQISEVWGQKFDFFDVLSSGHSKMPPLFSKVYSV